MEIFVHPGLLPVEEARQTPASAKPDAPKRNLGRFEAVPERTIANWPTQGLMDASGQSVCE
jgi:hypothetical protein